MEQLIAMRDAAMAAEAELTIREESLKDRLAAVIAENELIKAELAAMDDEDDFGCQG